VSPSTALIGPVIPDDLDERANVSLPTPSRPATTQLRLLGGFAVSVAGRRISLAESSQRVLALVALRERPVTRAHVAGTLWMDHTEARAAANLRSALWRLNQSGVDLLDCDGRMIELAPHVEVDVRRMIATGRGARDDAGGPGGTPVEALDPAAMAQELLPDWYDDWVILDRERLRQLRLHLLDLMCNRLTALGRFLDAIDVGLMAIAAEPLRESAHRAVIEAHLAEGNLGEARRQFEIYSNVLQDSACGEPSAALRALLVSRGCPVSVDA
jgi:DNA-binding SARP family transcriptional activator